MPMSSITVNEWRENSEYERGRGVFLFRPFIVCPTCGNKRCPHATDRQYECTASNEPGQPGSCYE